MTPIPSVVTDDEVERVAEAIHEEQRNTVLAALGIAEDDPRAMQRPQWQQETDGFRRVYRTLARAALAASDRDVLVAEIGRLREALRGLVQAVEMDAHAHANNSISGYTGARLTDARAALLPLGGG